MLAEFLLQAHHLHNKKESVLVALTTYSYLAQSDFVSTEQLVICRPFEEEHALLKVWLDPSLATCPDASHHCLTILNHFLRKNKRNMDILMELKVLDPLSSALEFSTQNDRGLVAGISLTEALLSSEDGDEYRMVDIL